MTFLYYTFTIIIQTIFNSVNFFYLLNCHNHSYSLQPVTYLYLCHNDVNCLRFRGAYLFAGRIKEQKFQISTRFQNENNNPLSSLNKIYVFTSWPQNILLAKQQLNILPNIISFFIPTSKHLRRRQWGQKRRVRTSIRQSFWKRHFGCWKNSHFFESGNIFSSNCKQTFSM